MELQVGKFYMRRDGRRCKVYEVFERNVIGAYEYIPGTWLSVMLNRDGSWMSDKETDADIVSEIADERKCDQCEATETERWHEDSAGVVICDDCYEAWCTAQQDAAMYPR